ncbi:MAG: C39 family peptidase [Caulobacteraceae bacterium]|nr:C39 family peptidase [Caulobacteraceae bacterium]
MTGVRTRGGSVAPLAAALALAAGGCVAVPVNVDRGAFARAPSRNAIPPAVVRLAPQATLLLDVRLDRQQASYSCGAHVVAAVVDYWSRTGSAPRGVRPRTGVEILAETPPADPRGYSVGEVAGLLQSAGLTALAVTADAESLRTELQSGRPVIARVSLPAGRLAAHTLLPAEMPLLGGVQARTLDLAAEVVEPWGAARIDHYWVVVGFDVEHFIVVDPILGLRAVRVPAFQRAFERGGRLAVVVGGWA